MANFRVVASNCGCCAIKHIRDFTSHPENAFYLDPQGHDEDQSSSAPKPYDNWAYELKETPENAGEAFKAIVAHIKDRRPSGMITCNLVEERCELDDYCCEDCNGLYEDWEEDCPLFDDSQIRAWQPIMDKLGFIKVVFLNSNSSNKIHHYTLVYEEN